MTSADQITEALEKLTRRRKISFWGVTYFIRPCLLSEVFGDGKTVLALQPLATRPDRYLIRVDSSTDLDSEQFYKSLEDLYNAIENEFFPHRDEYDHENGRTYVKHRPFPALDTSYGVSWWIEAKLH